MATKTEKKAEKESPKPVKEKVSTKDVENNDAAETKNDADKASKDSVKEDAKNLNEEKKTKDVKEVKSNTIAKNKFFVKCRACKHKWFSETKENLSCPNCKHDGISIIKEL